MGSRPAFLITIDTEGDNLWGRPTAITTENARFLPRFQALCERYGLKPTYLTNHEMACDKGFVAFAREAEARDAAEVGMHLHAWCSPPEHTLTADDFARMPYLIEYPTSVLKAKVRDMTARLEDLFGHKMVSHRAGRWALDERYVDALIEEGYRIDCSVTPYVSWRGDRGAHAGGTDYRDFPTEAYFIDPSDIRRAGASPLLEAPMTIMPRYGLDSRALPAAAFANGTTGRIANRLLPSDWLRPRRGNGSRMLAVLGRAKREERRYVEFMTHSSELMPGASPYFPDAESVEALYRSLEALFARAAQDFQGQTLAEFREGFDG